MTTTTRNTTEKIDRSYMTGVMHKTIRTESDGYSYVMFDAFVGTIDYIAEEKVAGYPVGSKMDPNYNVIEWLDEYTVQDFIEETFVEFDDYDKATEYYLSLASKNKVMRQKRRLIDGTIDTNVITYRW